jgi:C1A family cysteine protease
LRTTKRYGWVRDLPDKRDLKFARFVQAPVGLPPRVDLTPQLGPVYDQGQLGSCTANAVAAAILYEEKRLGQVEMFPSRLYIYWNSRELEGSTDSDSGAQLRDVFKSIGRAGVCSEIMFGYEHSFRDHPWIQCYIGGAKDLALQYLSVAQDLNVMKACLALGWPIVVGFTVYDSFESDAVAASGIVPMPDLDTESVVGGHAVLCCGYDDASSRFICRNSWGADWGQKGNFTIPYAYLTDAQLAGDFWTLRKMEV